LWKKLVAAPIAATLKQHGFRKKGLAFSAQRPGVLLLVTLQSGSGSTRDLLKVTCNLGIWVERLAQHPAPSIWESHWRQRLGFFLPDPRDHWWECSSAESSARVGEEIAELLESKALPSMEGLASPKDLAVLWSSGRSPGLTENQRVDCLARLGSAG
jgi:hypothetical protein